MTVDHFVIVGGGLAGAKAAQTLRAEGFTGQITLLGDEVDRPYERPPLSKALLLGTAERESVFVHDSDWYFDNDIDLHTGARVQSIDPAERVAHLADGRFTGYDRLLLATGSAPRQLDIPGAQLDEVLYLRTLPDSERLAASLARAANVVMIGAGWIGLEVAAAARARGATVTLVETLQLPLQRVLGDEMAQYFLDMHQSRGIAFHGGASVRELRGTSAVTAVVLADGTEIPADLVVASVGIQPSIGLAITAGLDTSNGITVDAAMSTSDPNIFAAGDAASIYHSLLDRHIRVEHWDNAIHTGEAAARAMLGQTVSYERLPYFFTDQYDLGMEYYGFVAPRQYDEVVFRGDPAGHEFIAFWVSDGRVLAGMNVNIWDVQEDIQALVNACYRGKPVDLARLSDPGVALTDLL